MENDESHTVICQDVFNEVHAKASKTVLMGDEQGFNDSLLCNVEESSEPSTLHVEARANVCEDQRPSLEMALAMRG